MLLPGLVGTGPLWRRACTEAEKVYRSGSWLILEGEAGAGKASLLQALHQRVNPGGRLSVLEPAVGGSGAWVAQARQTLAEKDGTVVLRHLERLPESALRVLTAALQDASARRTAWIAVAVPPTPPGPELTRLLRLFDSTVQLPPLRHHVEDVELLIPFLLMRLGYGGQLTVSPEVVQLLLRFDWPGNVEQLLATLRSVLRHRRTGVVQPSDLPPEIQSLARRRLTPLESLERDAIVLGLQDAAGNKARAARALGMSRATIYRKIHDYGIAGATVPAPSGRRGST
jgi:transcriptional regulator with AAA-type ATPase domain